MSNEKQFRSLYELEKELKEKQRNKPVSAKIGKALKDFFLGILVLIFDSLREIKWFLQRGFRGYDDNMCRDFYKWFLEIFPDILNQIIENTNYPVKYRPGFKITNGVLERIPKDEEISPEQFKAVLCYLYFKILDLRDFEDKALDLNNFNYEEEYNKLKNETIDLFKELFFYLKY